MTITEPSNLITDYVLGLVSLGISYALARAGNPARAARLWVGAPFFIAVSALAGGTVHGFRPYLGAAQENVLWTTTLIAIGLATFFFSVASYQAAFRGRWRMILTAAAQVQLVLYVIWVARDADFRYAVYNYAPTMLWVLGIHIYLLARGVAAARWIAGGIVVSFVAVGAQVTGWGFHEHFDHNDVYHVIQIAGVWCFYRGGRLLCDAADRQPVYRVR